MMRVVVLALVGATLAGVLVWRWVSGWGSITVDFRDAPLGKVVAAIERQGGVQIVTNADPSMPVTLQVRRAPLFEALETLAVRIEADLRVAYVFGPDRKAVSDGLAVAASGGRPEGWKIFRAGWGMPLAGETVPDLRRVSVQPTPAGSLHEFLDQLSQKTGVSCMVAEGWNPALPRVPPQGPVRRVAARTASSLGAASAEVVLLVVRNRSGDGGPRGQADAALDAPMGRRFGGGGETVNPEWAAERVLAQIALLPPEEQPQARQDFDAFRKVWEEMRALPEDQRQAKIDEMMARPEVQDRMEERQMSRDMRRSPEQRAQRYQQYVERKRQALSGAP